MTLCLSLINSLNLQYKCLKKYVYNVVKINFCIGQTHIKIQSFSNADYQCDFFYKKRTAGYAGYYSLERHYRFGCMLTKMRKLCLIFGQVQARRQSILYAKNRPAFVKYIEDKNELFCRGLAFRTIILINKRYTHFSYHIK